MGAGVGPFIVGHVYPSVIGGDGDPGGAVADRNRVNDLPKREIMKPTDSWIDVAASREIVHRYASDPALLAEWNNEYIECGAAEPHEHGVIFRCKTHCGDEATWTLDVSFHGSMTHVHATIDKHTGIRHPTSLAANQTPAKGFLAQSLARLKGFMEGGPRTHWGRRKMLALSLARLKGFAEAEARDHAASRPGGGPLKPGDKVALLNVYTGQFASYTTLLWQVPALGLTAQAFLMTIVLGGGSPVSHPARYTASVLSMVVALASMLLMHYQRARAINHAELAKRLSYRLSLTNLVGSSFALDDAVPRHGTDTQNVWAVNHLSYFIWMGLMCLFLIADGLVIYALALAGIMGWPSPRI
jgi:hypothetical protein